MIGFGVNAKAYPSMLIDHYTQTQGLPNNTVYCSLKGSDGFMWFGTWFGLTSFDGSEFRKYNIRDNYESEIPPRKIQMMEEDRNGYLWIKTIDHKLYIFDKRREVFSTVYDKMKRLSKNVQIIKLQRTTDGKIILLTKDKNIILASTNKKGEVSMKLVLNSKGHVDNLTQKITHNILYETADYICWLGTDFKIIYVEKKGVKAKIASGYDRCANFSNGVLCLASDKELLTYDGKKNVGSKYLFANVSGVVQQIYYSADKQLYVVTSTGVYVLKGKTFSLLSALDGTGVKYAMKDNKGFLWLLKNNKGVYSVDVKNGKSTFIQIPHTADITDTKIIDSGVYGMFLLSSSACLWHIDRSTMQANALIPSSVQSLLLDNSNVLWITSSADGVFAINFPREQFRMISLEKETGVRAMHMCRNGEMWVGSNQKKLYLFDRNGNVKRVFDSRNYEIGNVYDVFEDKSGTFWFATKGNGLVRAVPNAKSTLGYDFTRFLNDQKNRNSISSNDVYSVFQDRHGHIWIGLFGGGINLLQEHSDGSVYFISRLNGLKNYPTYGLYLEVRDIVEDKDGRIWVATTDGLMSFRSSFNRPDQINFEVYPTRNGESFITDNDVYALFIDHKKQLWMSVFGGGLSKMVEYDAKNHYPRFVSYGQSHGLITDAIMAITEDKLGNLWCSTEGGLVRFDVKDEIFSNFDKYDGMPTTRMMENSSMATANGEVWFGSKNGILVCKPEKMKPEGDVFPLYLIDLKISNKDLKSLPNDPSKGVSIKYLDGITLKHDQGMFSIVFSALCYVNPSRISYRYILEGFEEEWHNNGKGRIASYSSMPPGEYLFRVQAFDESNAGKVFERTFAITILPPWWWCWWSKTIYALVLAIIAYLVYRSIRENARMRRDIYIEQRVAEMKLKFFTNISHELRTPLTLIKGPIREVMQTEKLSAKGMKYMGLMEKNADQMLTLVNQILDFRKIQNGKMRLHVCEFDLNDFVGSFENEFGVIGEEGNIMFDFKLSDSPIKVWADKERMQIVVRNILTNAFKYTPPGGEVHVSTHLSDDAKKCYIEFQDTGDGIPEDKLEEIFERFTQADNARLNSNPGTGIGLALVHEIIGLHNGKVYASNVEPHGALFTIELQMGKEHYDANEVDFYIDEQMPMQSNAETLKVQEQYDESEPEMNEQLSSLLLVEDNKDLSDMLQMQLSGKYNVYRAVNGVEGLKKVRQYSPDLIVTDQMMPEMTGMEMLQEIRKDFQISHIPVIMLTAKNDDATRTKAITLGANAFITKPFSKEHLEAQIAQLLAERRAFRERLIRELQKKSAENVEVVNDIQKSETEPKDDKLLVKDIEGRLQFVNEYENTLSAPDRALLEKIKKVIEENMADPDFNIELIAVQLAVSRSVFFKKLKAITGLAPVELVRQIRLAKSCELIKATTSSFTEIAQIVGFNDLGYFGKCFKKRYGMTLKEYAAKYREF